MPKSATCDEWRRSALSRIERSRIPAVGGSGTGEFVWPNGGGDHGYLLPVRLRRERTVPIGRPVANTRVYILDQNLEPVPAEVAGEIYIGGNGLAWGYLNQPQLTAEKFIPGSVLRRSGARLYKSGDLRPVLGERKVSSSRTTGPSGKDKRFPHRAGEIEARLRKHRAVREAIVIVREEARKGRNG